LFAGVAGDLSPLTIEASAGTPRAAPPALVVAIAVGLGTVDMPWPAIAEWEWLNWKFPRPVHAGDTIYARWTLTQKRPPASGASSSIVVWRVDVHTADGAMCAEGEIGAKVKRHSGQRPAEPAAAAAPAAVARRRRRRSRGNGTPAESPPIAAPPAAAAKPERSAGPSRRRRRRRSGGGRAEEDHEPRAAHVVDTAAPTAAASPTPAASARAGDRGTIGRVLKRLRGS
jgi:acyl dehydratase